MNTTTILNKILPFVSPNMNNTRRNAVAACVQSLAQGNLSTATNIGSAAFEKHCIKRADRVFSNPHLQQKLLSIYAHMCRLFTNKSRPIISVD